MKKLLTMTLPCVLILSFLLVGCGALSSATAPAETPAPAPKPVVVEPAVVEPVVKNTLKVGTTVVLFQETPLSINNKVFDAYMNEDTEGLKNLVINNLLIILEKGTKVVVTKSDIVKTEVDVLDGSKVGLHGITMTGLLIPNYGH